LPALQLRRGFVAAVVVLYFAAPILVGQAKAADADTEHMFGFSEGSDIGHRGETEAEFETIGRFGRVANAYSAITTNAELKHVVTDQLRVSGAVAFSQFDISGLAGTSDQDRLVVDRISSELRYRVLDRTRQPIGLTFIATPFFGLVNPGTGAGADRYGATLIAAADKALVPDRLFAAFNLGYAFESDRLYANGQYLNSSTLSVNLAASARLAPWLYLGAETRYLQDYGGMTPDLFAGQALYLGPVFYLPVARGFSISGAWNFQAWGQASGAGGNLDLANFERQQVKLRLSIDL
jgi:hypothetical protein